MRRCKGKYIDQKEGIVEFDDGYFHQWGCDYEEYESGPANFTTAIVELPDGRVVTPPANMIEFKSDYITELPGAISPDELGKIRDSLRKNRKR